MTGIKGRVSIAGGALIIIAGLVIPVATATTSPAVPPPAQGVDVSSLQHLSGSINWADVAAHNVFAGVKASEGDYYTNSYYASDVQQATGAGLYVIPYAFANPFDSVPAGNGTAAQQADTAASEVSSVSVPANLMLPLALDLEPDPYASQENSNECYGLSTSAMRTWIGEFITEAGTKLHETRPLIIYTEPEWWNSCTGNYTGYGNNPLWLASYGGSNPALPAGWNNYTFWQYSASGTVSGITGGVDVDYLGPVIQASQVGKAIGPVQLRTLTSLVGQTAVSYQPGSLLPGLTLSSSGQITGTPTTIGKYTVTVTSPAGAVPAATTFTWDVHGTITVTSPGNRATIAGTPVWLRVQATDPDTGYPPSFSASGLPPGLSMNSSGVITGWPYSPGTYHVTVSASDGLYGSGSATFTWTVTAAADSGSTAAIRQWGGSGKCLDDERYGTSNGSLVDLWSCTGRWNQSWTMAQDGTIRVGGKCLDVIGEGTTNGTMLQLWTCDSGDGGQQWLAGTDSQLVNPQSGKCLYVPGSNAANGTRPQLWTCASNPAQAQANEHWLRPAASVYSGEPGKCLAVSGSAAVLAGCANTSAQHWTQEWDGTLRLGSKCLTQTGSGATIGSCSGAVATKWQLRGTGALPIATEIANAGSGQCLTAPSATNGVKLVLGPCAPTDPATWHAE